MDKFNLMNQANYNRYLPNIELSTYPEFTIDEMGIYVQLGIDR